MMITGGDPSPAPGKGIPSSEGASTPRPANCPSFASKGVIVSPMAVTICQKAAVSLVIRPATEAAARTMRVVSEGDDMTTPVSAATAAVAPDRRSNRAVTTALIARTPSTAASRVCQLSMITLTSTLIPTVMRNTPSARPRNGAVITSTSS